MADQHFNHENRDPISGEKGAHPVGTGIGAALGGAAGIAGTVAAGTVLGPAGVLVGTAIGALAGGLVGKGAAEVVNPTEDEYYWREHFESEPWYESGLTWEDYQPAFSVGREGRSRFSTLRFEEVERDLEQDYMNGEGRFGIPWEKARHAARAAWDRADADERPAADGPYTVKTLVSPTGAPMPFEEPRKQTTSHKEHSR